MTHLYKIFLLFCCYLHSHTPKCYFFKELTESGNETLREIKNLIDKLGERDEKIEQISTWLQSDLEEIRSLMEQESETDFLSK